MLQFTEDGKEFAREHEIDLDSVGKLLELQCSCGVKLEAFKEGLADISDVASVPCMDDFDPAWEARNQDEDSLDRSLYVWQSFLQNGVYAATETDAYVAHIEMGLPHENRTSEEPLIHDVYDGRGNKIVDGNHVPESAAV